MKTMKRISAILLAVLLIATLGVTALAAGDPYSYPTLTLTSANKVTVEVYLLMDTDTSVPAEEFTFSIAPGTAIAAGENTLPVAAGPTTGSGDSLKPSVSSVTFGSSYPKYSTIGTDDHIVGPLNGRSYVKGTVDIDFTGITFTEPGIYRYVLTEDKPAAGTARGITYDVENSGEGTTKGTRYLDLYVIDTRDATNPLQVNAVMHTTAAAPQRVDVTDPPATGTLGDKSFWFVNEYTTLDLEFKKEVIGNQASRDKYFKFTVTFSGAGAGTVFPVDLNTAVKDISANPNTATTCIESAVTQPTSITATDGTASQVFYLQHGQSIIIHGIAPNVSYTVSEDTEDYKSTAGGVEGYAEATQSAENKSIKDSDTNSDGVVKTSYLNTRNGIVPTGVMLTVVPGVVLVVLAVIGLVLFSRKKSRA